MIDRQGLEAGGVSVFGSTESRGRPRYSRICVITTLFNPRGYHSLANNYRRFAEHMHAHGVRLLTAELLYPGQSPSISGPDIIRFEAQSVLWHKERLLNLLVERLPHSCEMVAWIDADILFTNDRWVEETIHRLEHVPVVQLFEKALLLDSQGNHYRDAYGFAFSNVNGFPKTANANTRHPGFAWAARREAIDAWGGLYDRHILGGGDYQIALGTIGDTTSDWYQRFGPTFREHMREWAELCHAVTRGRIGYVPGSVLHLWHGHMDDRRYVERSKCLVEHAFDPINDIGPGKDGLWQWTSGKPSMQQAVASYFALRNDDQDHPVHPTRYEDKVPVIVDPDGGPDAFRRILRLLATQNRLDFAAQIACHDWNQLHKIKPIVREYPWPFEVRLRGHYSSLGVPRRLQLARALASETTAQRCVFVDRATSIPPDFLNRCATGRGVLISPPGKLIAADMSLLVRDELYRKEAPYGPGEERVAGLANALKHPVTVIGWPQNEFRPDRGVLAG